IQELKKELQTGFRMKDLGEAQFIIGIKIERSEKEIAIHQHQYIEKVIQQFGMENCKGVHTPLQIPSEKEPPNYEILEDATLYRKAVGCLNFLATGTKPDISYAVQQISKVMQQPTQRDWMDVKRILRYLKQTKGAKLKYKIGDKMIEG